MHTVLVQRLLRDRSAWDLVYGYDESPEAAKVGAETLPAALSAHA
jgi:UDP-3-O-[3-hydroxymyristoyl] N-acetylglucosamine deacetylase